MRAPRLARCLAPLRAGAVVLGAMLMPAALAQAPAAATAPRTMPGKPAVPVGPALSAAPAAPGAPAAPASRPALTAADAETWLDGLMPTALRTTGVPGAVVVIVKDGQPLLQKGYGYADLQQSVPVDPARTLFRPGSISKLFTWTAVMQLVEQGKLDLDADVNRYLDFQVPGRNGKALTLRHAMTHTTGLEETGRDLIIYEQYTPDLGKVLKSYIPPYLYDPGTTQGYSNWATGLAGYIVQRVSGQPFDDYVEQHIFAPLRMHNATFRQPLPAALRAQMSGGYASVDEPAKPFEVVNMAPAGSLSATGADMGRFMLAYLQRGELDGARILKPETVDQMRTQITRGMPDLNGIGLGFYQQDMNGHRAFGHGGDTFLFHSDLILLVDDGIGIFVSFNAPGRNDQGKWLRERLYQGFADRYLPDTRPAAGSVDEATAKAHAQLLAGAYRNSRREDSTFFSVLQLLSPFKIHAEDHGRVSLALGGNRSVFREVRPFLWQEEHGKRRIQALVENGQVKRWGMEPYVFAFVFEPVPFMAGGLMLVLLLAALAVVLLTVLLWPVAAALRRKHGAALPSRAATWVRVASSITLASLVLWTLVFVTMEQGGAVAALLALAQGATWLGFVGGLAAAVWHARARFAGATLAPRTLSVLWVAAYAVLVLVGLYYHLLSFNPDY